MLAEKLHHSRASPVVSRPLKDARPQSTVALTDMARQPDLPLIHHEMDETRIYTLCSSRISDAPSSYPNILLEGTDGYQKDLTVSPERDFKPVVGRDRSSATSVTTGSNKIAVSPGVQ